jgi:hypothetical protein
VIGVASELADRVGLRFGSGPCGARSPAAGLGRRDGIGREGGAMRPLGLAGGGIMLVPLFELGLRVGILGGGIPPPARCAEFMAGNDGGGRLSSSESLSSTSTCSASVNVGTGVPFVVACALGVLSPACSDCDDLGLSDSTSFEIFSACRTFFTSSSTT